MAFQALRAANGRPKPLLVVLCLGVLVTFLFGAGIEAFSHHHHDGPLPDPNCVACRQITTPASTTPSYATLGTLLFQNAETNLPTQPAEIPASFSPAPCSLRGPPLA